MAYFTVRSGELIFGCHNLVDFMFLFLKRHFFDFFLENLRGKKFLNPSCLDPLGLMIFSASEKPGICPWRCRPRCHRKKKTKRILFALRMMLPLESIGFYWFGFRNFMVCFFEKKHLDAKSHIFSTWFRPDSPHPFAACVPGPFAKANGSRTASCRSSEGVGL